MSALRKDRPAAKGLPIVRQARELLWAVQDQLTTLRSIARSQNRLVSAQEMHLRRIEMLVDRLSREHLEEASKRYADARHLARFERQVFSQSGEDGILAEVFRRIGEGARTCVEFGVGDGLENNTAFLLCQGWRGWWLEGDTELVRQIETGLGPLIARGQLRVEACFIESSSIAGKFETLGVPVEVDLLSIDIDGNDYWVWKALIERKWRPRVVVIEYNAIFPPGVRWTILENPAHRWDGSGYQGASLTALVELAETCGYALVGARATG